MSFTRFAGLPVQSFRNSVNWYCVHTRPLREAQVSGYLANNAGVEIYYPRICEKRTIRRVKRLITSPLFPRYLFCRTDLQFSYRSVRYAPDVIDLVHFGDHPAIVEDNLIAELKAWAGETGDVISLEPTLHCGDEVQVTEGPMRGLTAVILYANNDRDRVAILLSTLQCGVHLTISRSQLRAVRAI